MRILFLVLAMQLISCGDGQAPKQAAQKTEQAVTKQDTIKGEKQSEIFEGAWFKIDYPAIFTAQPSQRSATAKDGFESAFFHSPDSSVTFYIFSPQWNGKPLDIEPKANEKAGAFNSESNEKVTINRWSIEDKKGRYSWAFEETIDHVSNTNKVFGIRYVSQKKLDQYQNAYLHFKNSLKQFAD